MVCVTNRWWLNAKEKQLQCVSNGVTSRLYWTCDYLTIPRLKLIHISKMRPRMPQQWLQWLDRSFTWLAMLRRLQVILSTWTHRCLEFHIRVSKQGHLGFRFLACRLFDTKQLSEPITDYCWMDPRNTNQCKLNRNKALAIQDYEFDNVVCKMAILQTTS